MNLAYHWYEAVHAGLRPTRWATDAMRLAFSNPFNPLSYTPHGRTVAAACELFERTMRRYAKPAFGLDTTLMAGDRVPVRERVVWERPFCRLLHFAREARAARLGQPKLLIVAPMSGHHATLLRGTVEAFLPTHDVYITDWVDARRVPASQGAFDLDSYIDYVVAMLRELSPNLHVLAVCQSAVPVLAAVALMEAEQDPSMPLSMTLIGGPIDTRKSPTRVNQLAQERGFDWFRRNCIVQVPFLHPGFGRDVYPGFLQLCGFMAMNIDRHVAAHWKMFQHLIEGDGDSADKQRAFYDEYLAVMDMTAEFYLQTVDLVFVRHALPKGEMAHRGKPVDLSAIRRVALMTVEGERDDICGVGQTKAAHDLCPHIPPRLRRDHLQRGVGHYGIFNGSRFCAEIAPRIATFHLDVEKQTGQRNVIIPWPRRSLPRQANRDQGAIVAFA
jgi:poly(3-hydroxybutyrate) depolymerase